MDEAFDKSLDNQSSKENQAVEDEDEDSSMGADKHAREDTGEEDKHEDEARLRNKIYREAMRLSILNSVRRHCPSLAEIAGKKVAEIHRMAILEDLAMPCLAPNSR